MKIQNKTVEMFLTVTVPESGQSAEFKILDPFTAVLLHPQTKEACLKITHNPGKDVEVTALGPLPNNRSVEHVAGCIKQCSTECAQSGNAGILCSTSCVVLCSTIIV